MLLLIFHDINILKICFSYLISTFVFFRFLYCTPCDLASFTSIRECANKIKEKEKRIDGLLNNAGVMYAPKSYSEDGIEIHWAVNHLGHYLLTKLLKDQLMGGRVLYMIDMNYRYVLMS